MSDSLWPHGLYSTRLLCPWDFQARVLEWVTISFSRGSSWPRDQTQVSCIAGRRFTLWATREASVFSEYTEKNKLHSRRTGNEADLETKNENKLMSGTVHPFGFSLFRHLHSHALWKQKVPYKYEWFHKICLHSYTFFPAFSLWKQLHLNSKRLDPQGGFTSLPPQ